MIDYPSFIKPELLSFGPLKIRWYGLMYVLGYFLGFAIVKKRVRQGLLNMSYRECESYVTYLIVGMLIGARLTYVFVYNWDSFSQNPIEILYVWQGGLSFHGAMVGMVTAGWLYGRKLKIPFYMLTDAFAMSAPPGLFCGRMGNFINAELYGRKTDLPWAMIFPTDPERLPRHPSQLYQGLTEGLLLFLILYFVQRRSLKKGWYRFGVLSATFLIGYGVMRFFTEFAREPDAQLGFIAGGLSMGQILCLLTIFWGLYVIWDTRHDPLQVPKTPSPEMLQ